MMKPLHPILTLLTIVSAAVYAPAASAQQAGGAGAQASGTAKLPAATGEVVTIAGTVSAIDASNRVVTLKGDDGKSARVYVGRELRNFGQLAKGDKVSLRYMEAMAVALNKGSDANALRQRVEGSAFGQTPQGAKPGLQAMEHTTVVADVFQIDRQAGKLTLRGTDGEPRDVRVPDKQMLNDVQTGDQIVISYVEATALAIQPQ